MVRATSGMTRMRTVSIALVAGVIGCVVAQPAPAGKTANFRETVLWSFGSGTDGAYPDAAVVEVNGILYGTTYAGGDYDDGQGDGGTVFALDPNTGAEKVVHSFCSQTYCPDGSSPVAGLIKVGGKLYGTATHGGSINEGAVFVLNPSTGFERVLYSFCSQQNHQNCVDGADPLASLINVSDVLYGTTCCDGAHFGGTAFALDRGTGVDHVLYQFCQKTNCSDGNDPGAGGLIDFGGTLYGTTNFGGADGNGTVFSINPITGLEKVLYSFCGGQSICRCNHGECSGGSEPQGLVGLGSTLYGTTFLGGVNDSGTVFSIDPISGSEKVLHSFGAQPDGVLPSGKMIRVSGTLYGTTEEGGDCGKGIIFSINPKTGEEKVVYSFCGQADGSGPGASPINVNGTFYGTTTSGGTYNKGTVYSITPQGG
jgi:uncharacterized repeat protein (TIGR03803 family)